MKNVARALLLALALASCGARSPLEVELAEPRLDARSPDGGADAPPVTCPAPSSFGFTLVPLADVTLDAPYGEISVAGDGARVILAAELRARAELAVVTMELDPRGGVRPGSEGSFLGVDRPRVALDGGEVRLLFRETGATLRLVTPSLDASSSILHGPLVVFDRPVWNGASVVVAGENGFEAFLGAFVPGDMASVWRSFGPASDVRAAADPSGITALLLRDGSGQLRVETFSREGLALWPPGGTTLEGLDFSSPLAFGLLDDGTGQPWVVAGFTTDTDGARRATLRRFRTEGAAAGGFSAPLSGTPGTVDLTTHAPVGHASGYGVVWGIDGGGALFHGAGEDFVGDARPVPLSCDGRSVSIAAGPCGYVIACGGGGAIHLALAVPPRPR